MANLADRHPRSRRVRIRRKRRPPPPLRRRPQRRDPLRPMTNCGIFFFWISGFTFSPPCAAAPVSRPRAPKRRGRFTRKGERVRSVRLIGLLAALAFWISDPVSIRDGAFDDFYLSKFKHEFWDGECI